MCKIQARTWWCSLLFAIPLVIVMLVKIYGGRYRKGIRLTRQIKEWMCFFVWSVNRCVLTNEVLLFVSLPKFSYLFYVFWSENGLLVIKWESSGIFVIITSFIWSWDEVWMIDPLTEYYTADMVLILRLPNSFRSLFHLAFHISLFQKFSKCAPWSFDAHWSRKET